MTNMKSTCVHRKRPVKPAAALLLMSAASILLVSGCSITDGIAGKFTDKYHIENYYIDSSSIQRTSRVVVVPFSNATGYACATDEVTPIFVQELRKARKFDVILAEGKDLSVISEKYANGSYDLGGYVSSLCTTYGANGVLIGEVKEYQAYKPFVLGVKFSLYTPEKNGAIWSVDETLDASMKRVASSSKYYYTCEIEKSAFKSGSEIMADSPKMYAQFVCCSLIATLEDGKRKR